MEIFKARKAQSFISLDPRTKLLITVIISSFMLSGRIAGNVIYPRMVFASIPFILLLSGKRIKASIFYVIALVAGELSEIFFVYSTSGILNILVTMLSGLVTRFVPAVVMGYYLITTTTVSEFIAGMQRLHSPQQLTIPLSVMFRFFPTVGEESMAINDAMRMRGVGIKSFSKNPASVLEYRFVPLLMSIVKIGEELSASALTRGLGSEVKRTNICKIGFGAWDFVFIIIVLIASVFYFIL